ncbi:major capsid protein [Clostridium sp.]|uniref:major capsid protein n=1 Tax=Clostridium sp. TaxID=1506 RepID=UPI00321632A0
MANVLTQLADIITPEIYNAYMQQYTAEKSAFVQSGIAVVDSRVAANITNGGLLVNMPFWNDLSGEDEVLDDGDTELGTDKITAGKDMAAVMYRGRAWKVNELSAVISGDDPLKALMSKVAAYWVRREQAVLISVLKGLFGTQIYKVDSIDTTFKGPLVDTHLNDISGGTGAVAKISGGAILDTKQLLGDAADRVKALGMHSAVFTALQKQQLIEYVSEASNPNIRIPYYLGYRIAAVDDGLPVEGTGTNAIYTTFLFGDGAIGRNEGTPKALTSYETDREKLKGNDIIITRRAMTMHPYGVKFTDAQTTGITPSNAELSDVRNWAKVYENKNIGLLALKHKI